MTSDAPAVDHPAVGISDEADVGRPGSGLHTRQIGDSQRIGCSRGEVAADQVGMPRRGDVRFGGSDSFAPPPKSLEAPAPAPRRGTPAPTPASLFPRSGASSTSRAFQTKDVDLQYKSYMHEHPRTDCSGFKTRQVWVRVPGTR
jgi:hypothetical protein